jgi:hypothetical protein
LVAGGIKPLNIKEGQNKFAQVSGVYTGTLVENPSFVYRPVTGPELVSKMLSPSKIEVVLGLVQTGWAVDSLLGTLAFSANGKANRDLQELTAHQPDAEFIVFVRALRQAQLENALTVRFEEPTAEEAKQRLDDIAAATSAPTTVERRVALANLGPAPITTRLCFRTSRLSQQARGLLKEMRAGLRLDPENECYQVIAADQSPDSRTIAIQMRSMFQLMTELALYVDVPEEDLVSGAAPRLAWSVDGGPPPSRPLRVQAGLDRPQDAMVAVEHADHWFWVASDDLQSKQTFLYLILLLSVTESGGSATQLVVSTTN